MNASVTFSPVSLSYAAALRGVKPRHPGTAFTYAAVNCQAPDLLTALAASNPEGRFYGFIADAALSTKAADTARMREVGNVTFLPIGPAEVLARFEAEKTFLPRLNYLVCDESEQPLAQKDRLALFDWASKALLPGGLLVTGYQATATTEETLRFLVREFAPEMSAEQACEFLLEIKKLGSLFFKDRQDLAAKLDQAIARNMPDEFFSLFDKGEARTKTFDTIVALRPRGFAYAGDCHIPSNYVELSVPPEAQPIVVECRTNPLYESIKDFVLNRTVRHDIWCRLPAEQSTQPAELFGNFVYGIATARSDVPAELVAHGKTIRVDTPLYTKLIDLMTLMPVSIGDFLSYPDGKEFAVKDVVEATQILVAYGIARPMRGLCNVASEHINNIAQPRLVGAFNQYLDKIPVTGNAFALASPVVGDVVSVSARDALVMQALDRAGLANSAEALLPELLRLARMPAEGQRIMDSAEPTAETARQMIEDVVSRSIVQWYAYGLLEAA